MISEDLARIVYQKALGFRIECNVSETFDENINVVFLDLVKWFLLLVLPKNPVLDTKLFR